MAFQFKEHNFRLLFARFGLAVMVFAGSTGSPSQAGSRDAERQMREFERDQRREERRQREAERDAKEQEKRAKELQAEQARQAAQSKQAIEKNNGSGASGTSAAATVKSSGTSSTSDSRAGSTKQVTNSNAKAPVSTQSEPPRTVQKWLEQLAGPKVEPAAPPVAPPKPVAPANGAAVTHAPVPKSAIVPKAVQAAAKPIAKADKGAPSTGGMPEPIAFPDVPLPEILAVNASAATVAYAKSIGFTATPPTSLASLDMSVTRLLPPKGMSSSDAQALLNAQLPNASFAPNMKYRIYRTAAGVPSPSPSGVPTAPSTAVPQTCSGDRCFAQDIIGWTPALRKCASGLKIGIIDTAVDVSHPTFKRKRLEVRHFGRKDRPGPDWHGTGVAALLAGDGNSATPGLIPDASFYVADIFYAGEDSGPASDTLSMLRAFNWLEANGVKIINMSLSGPPDALIKDAVASLAAKGILLVAAAGNDGPHNAGPSYPAAYDDVIAVTAVNKKLQNYRYANRGAYVDVSAPGVAIWTALPGSQNGYHSGTSFATPYVTASLAAIYSRTGGQTSSEALQSLTFRDLGDAGVDPVYGRGLLVAPQSCNGDQIAATPQQPPASAAKDQATVFGLFAPSSATPTENESTEQLPWLSLGGPQ